MSAARERILGLLARGVIDAAEAERLLAALGPSGGPSPPSALLNPFVRLGPAITIACGLVAGGLGLLWAARGIRMDGFLDLHVTPPTSWQVALRDQLAGWPVAVIVFYLASRFIARAPARLVDVAGVVGLARVPTAIVAPLAPVLATGLRSIPSMLVLTVVVLALVVQLVWLFQGLRHAHGRSTPTASAAFVLAVVISEVLSKLIVLPRA